MLLAEKLPCEARTFCSMESYSSDQLLKSQDQHQNLSKPTATTVLCCSNSSATVSGDLTLQKSTSDLPALSSSDFPSCSPKLKERLLQNHSNLTSDITGLRLSCTEVLQPTSSCSSAESQGDERPSTQNTTESPACLSLKDSDGDSSTLQNHVSENLGTGLEDSADADFQNSRSLVADSAYNAVKDYSGVVDLGLHVSVDSALDSKRVTATILSPSEDFRSIYASNSGSLTTSATAGGTSVSEPETVHSFPDLDSVDAWLEFPLPGKSTALSLCVSRRAAWYVDKAQRLYCSSLKGPGLCWNAVDQPAEQISCSPSGFIVWRVYRGSAFSAVGKINVKFPSGTEWREVAREVAYVAVDDTVVW